jgi:LPS sulfotransferase NodH
MAISSRPGDGGVPRYTSEAYDTGVEERDAPPPKPFLICATPRSGSNLLCDGIAGTGLVGPCFEHFNARHRAELERRFGCDGSLDSYMRAIYGRRTTADGYLGVKLHWDQVPALRSEALGVEPVEPPYGTSADFLELLFPGAAYIRILRLDVNRQAVSLWIAFATGVWTVDGDPVPATEPAYSFEGIERCRRAIENAEVHWDRFFRANGIEPLTVVYERLVDDFEATVSRVVAHLRPDAGPVDVAAPSLRRLAGAATEDFLERYARDRSRNPAPQPEELAQPPVD